MKLTHVITTAVAVTVIGISSTLAAPVESIESGRAAALAKVQGFVAEKTVADQLTSLGLSRDQVNARLAQLNDAQLEQLAAQVDMIRAAADVQGDSTGGGVVGEFFKQLGAFFYNLFQVIFFWRK